MDNLTKTAEDLKRLAVKFKGILELAEALERIGSFEQAAREATARKDAALAEEKGIRGTLDARERDLAAADKLIEDKAQEAKQIRKVANENANAIVRIAEKKAKEIVEEAEKSETIVYGETLKAKVSLEELQKSIKAKEAELLKIKGQIQTAKDKIASL